MRSGGRKAFFFSDLLELEHDQAGNISPEALRALSLPMPRDVLEQICADHGRKDDFQAQYAHLDLRQLTWALESLTAAEIIAASVYERFRGSVETVSLNWVDAPDSPGADWILRDPRADVVRHWVDHRTWLRPPVFVEGFLVGSSVPLHLMEGHTRLGVLKGLVDRGLLRESSAHEAWVGRPRSQPSGLSNP